jgi:hypothetical protein
MEMKKFILILGLFFSLSTNTWADVCYDINETVAKKAIDIIKTQKEIYQYCSICPDAEPYTVEVHDIKENNPIYVNGIALDLAHTYYKQNNKFVNLGIASGCIKAEEYNIATELESFDSHIKEKNKLNDLKQKFEKCFTTFETEERKCPKSWSIKCYNYLIQANKNIQSCYKKIAIDLFNSYYNLSKSDAEKKFDTFQKFIYDQYIFIYTKSNYCEKNNCGVSIYLYSEYATTQELYHYVNRIIGSISARN